MKNKTNLSKLILPVLATLILINSCKKDSPANNTPLTSANYKVKSIIDAYTGSGGNSTDTTTFTYDGQGRLLTALSSQGNTIFTYSGNTVSIVNPYLPVTLSGTLGSNGLITSIVQPQLPTGQPITDYTYAYNAAGDLLSAAGYYSTNNVLVDSSNYTWTDSNLVSVIYSNGSTLSHVSYTYTTTREYRDYGFSYGFGYDNFCAGIIAGRNSRNLINTETDTDGSGSITTYTYAYTFDSYGRVITETAVDQSGNKDVYTYAYN